MSESQALNEVAVWVKKHELELYGSELPESQMKVKSVSYSAKNPFILIQLPKTLLIIEKKEFIGEFLTVNYPGFKLVETEESKVKLCYNKSEVSRFYQSGKTMNIGFIA